MSYIVYTLCTIYLCTCTISDFPWHTYLPQKQTSFMDIPLQVIFNEIDLSFLLWWKWQCVDLTKIYLYRMWSGFKVNEIRRKLLYFIFFYYSNSFCIFYSRKCVHTWKEFRWQVDKYNGLQTYQGATVLQARPLWSKFSNFIQKLWGKT